jgi:hypothetical protein
MPETVRKFICKVQNCPMERDIEDDKHFHHENLQKVFGDDFNVVSCEKVENKAGRMLFCEMLIETERTPLRDYCPDGFSIVMEV